MAIKDFAPLHYQKQQSGRAVFFFRFELLKSGPQKCRRPLGGVFTYRGVGVNTPPP